MTDLDVTSELPLMASAHRAERNDPPLPEGFDDDAADRYLQSEAFEVADRESLPAVLAAFWQRLTETPRRAAAVTAWVFALLVALVCLVAQPTVTVQSGPVARQVKCGVDIYLYGYPDRGVQSACQNAEAVRFGLFVPAVIIVLIGVFAALLLALRSSAEDGKDSVWRDPLLRAGVGVGALALLVDAFALRPAPVELVSGGQLMTARCGADSWLFGYPDPAIQSACGRAYDGHAYALVVATIFLLAAAGVVMSRLVGASSRWDARRLAVAVSGAVLAVAGAVALVPVSVVVDEAGGPVTAQCGIDSYLAGYPDHAVLVACRAHYGGHLLAGVLLLVAAAVCLVAQRLLRPPASRTGLKAGISVEVAG